MRHYSFSSASVNCKTIVRRGPIIAMKREKTGTAKKTNGRRMFRACLCSHNTCPYDNKLFAVLLNLIRK